MYNQSAITYGSYVTLSLSGFPEIHLYSDGFMEDFSIRSFHNLHGNLFHDFQNAVFRVLPVMSYKWSEELLTIISQGDI